MKYARRNRCPLGGSPAATWGRFSGLQFTRCDDCGVIVLPYALCRWLSPWEHAYWLRWWWRARKED
jgi:hypothetical protein